ncbi:relaxase/mobilization nuclease domain-containing protein [Campylobacter concisus]|uniref:relaxase/mobilization nuclease domain-containing protein n=1 Tax=Campylobacter concisus TaxID=199 RepID=UPI000CD86375|nr:relaxase/mobilization nuclease domain-containing protein [Campylobacter concisus]QPH87666.1 relaxase/mobilization nuclease domain-containing protein [Campylobacter concisus]QPI02610.1 relaxase/mobilization nuclease domain-containing protein [Campylobacter concisus]
MQNAHDGLCVNEKGERVGSDKVMREWGKDFDTNKNLRDAWHLVFSIKEPIDYERKLKALEASVRETMGTNFFGHKYVCVLHTHQNNPHVHVVLNKRSNFTKKKLHFDSRSEISEFFDNVCTSFAVSLDSRGLDYDNKHSLQKDLKQEFNRLKTSVKLETDEYTTKDKINDY